MTEHATLLAWLTAGAVASGLLTEIARRYAVRRGVMDHPTDRSSHTRPTPRGGGIAIATVLFGGIVLQVARGTLSESVAIPVLIGGGAVAAVGWLDDRGSVAVAVRLAVHTFAALVAVFAIGGLAVLRLGPSTVQLGTLGSALALLWVVWLINLYNFMDGIDGLAGSEAAFVALLATLLVGAAAPGLAAVLAVLTGAAIGFLRLNWSPARIFMGDVGSGLIGYTFAVFSLATEVAGVLPLVCWALLLSAFLFDATVTLLRRLTRRHPVVRAHRLHAYQRAVQSGFSHARVTSGVLLLNVVSAVAAVIAFVYPAYTLVAVAWVATALIAAYVWVERRHPMMAGPSWRSSS